MEDNRFILLPVNIPEDLIVWDNTNFFDDIVGIPVIAKLDEKEVICGDIVVEKIITNNKCIAILIKARIFSVCFPNIKKIKFERYEYDENYRPISLFVDIINNDE